MAENSDGQERTEQPTPKRLRESAEKGQIPRSRELTTLLLLLSATGGLLVLGPALLSGLALGMKDAFTPDVREFTDPAILPRIVGEALVDMLWLMIPFLGLMVLVALLAPLALGGWSFSVKALAFKPDRINPLKGVGRIFSLRALMELVKALAKFLVVGGVAVWLLWGWEPQLLHLASQPLLPALYQATWLLGWLFLLLTLPLILIALVDVPFQIFNHTRQMRMTKQEVRDEMKDTEGKPEVKSRIRRLQQEFAQRRMMDKVPQADVIITNPNHYAVALKYDPDTMTAPRVEAKGVDLVALRIRQLGEAHRVPRVESPLLARALYFNCELDQPIPATLYTAVAQVLAYVFQLRAEQRLDEERIVMSDLPVPPGMRTQ